jgi:protein gp37
MGQETGITWCDSTFCPWEGCTKIGPGCDFCYAESRNQRFHGGQHWGAGAPRLLRSDKYWNEPLKWERNHEAFMQAHGHRQRVFCASLADVFDNEAPEGQRERLFALMRATPHLDWLILTKRIGNVPMMLPLDWGSAGYPNVWLGATVVNQEEADRDIPKLLRIQATVRFLSMEPLLGEVDLGLLGTLPKSEFPNYTLTGNLLHWVIVGGESGNKARPMHPDWMRSLRDQCEAADVAFFMKQWGEWGPHQARAGGDEGGDLRRGHVRYLQGDGREPDGYFRKGDAAVARIGTKAAGCLLDGMQHHAFPVVQP